VLAQAVNADQLLVDVRARRPSQPTNRPIRLQGGPKNGTHDHYSLKILTDLKEKFHWKIPWGKFAVKWILNIPPHLACVATLPRETSISAKQAIYDKLRSSVARYFRWGCFC